MNLGRGLVAQISILDQRFVDDLLQTVGKAGHRLVQRKRRLAQNGVHGHRPRGSGESLLAGGHFVEQNAEGEKIGAYVERFTAGLLRGHIGQGADGRAGMRERTAHRHRGIV